MAKILFVDDEELMCEIATQFFHMKNHQVTTASCYSDARTILENDSFDVLLVDINMPGPKNGLDLLRDAKADMSKSHIILITGMPSLDSATEALRLGAFDYVLKPFDINMLSTVVDKALQEKRLKDEKARIQLTLEKHQGILEKTLIEQIHEIRVANNIAREAHVKSLQMLARAAEYHDDATSRHINRVGAYSALLTKNLGMSSDEQDVMLNAAPMHDVGKVGIPYQILTKPGKLDTQEFALIKEHCVIGYDILKDEDHPYHKAAAVIALSHHERFNGQGYPCSLHGKEIPLYGRIVAVTDVYDALISPRVYKPAWSVEQAVEHIRSESGKHFDPNIVECFLDSLDELDAIRHKIDQEEERSNHHDDLMSLKNFLLQANRAN